MKYVIISCIAIGMSIIVDGCGHRLAKATPNFYFETIELEEVARWLPLSEDGQRVGWYIRHGDKIYCYDGIIAMRIPGQIEEADINTFEVCEGSRYAKDKNHIYYPIVIECVEGNNFGYMYADEYILDADVESFKYIGGRYAVDKDNMYLEGKKIPWDEAVIKRAKDQQASHEGK